MLFSSCIRRRIEIAPSVISVERSPTDSTFTCSRRIWYINCRSAKYINELHPHIYAYMNEHTHTHRYIHTHIHKHTHRYTNARVLKMLEMAVSYCFADHTLPSLSYATPYHLLLLHIHMQDDYFRASIV